MTVTLMFPVEPKPKGRPRFSRRGFAYTPKETREFEDTIIYLAEKQWVPPVVEGEIHVIVRCVSKRPKKPSKNYPRYDVDNAAKAVLDALNGIVFEDDKQIVTLIATKEWALPGHDGYIWVQITDSPIPHISGF